MNNKYIQLSQWISDLLDEKISEDDFKSMQILIHSDPAYMRYYVEYVSLCALMEKRCLKGSLTNTVNSKRVANSSPEDTSEIILKLMEDEEGADRINPTDLYPERKVNDRRISTKTFQLPNIIIKVAAVLLICFGILQLDDLIVNYQPEDPLPKIARVSGQIDSELLYKGEQKVTDTWLWPGVYHLRSGCMSLRYLNGARVVLEAPAVFKLESFDTVHLTYGKLFANVPQQAKGFTVNTDNAKVMDLGTEFGVNVSEDGKTGLYVYKGKTALVCNAVESLDATQMVTAGNARAVSHNSDKVNKIELKENVFVRSIDINGKQLWRGQHICLADIVGGGNGFGTGTVEVGIDPVTGERGEYSIYDRETTGDYVAMLKDRYIDGVFVPSGNGQVISTQNTVFENCPITNHVYYADIICGTGMKSTLGALDELMILNGEHFGTVNNPGISMHANLGITFDLGKIREDVAALCVTPSEFTASIGVSDLAYNDPHAQVWVLVDGEIRFTKVIIKRGVAYDISVKLKKADKFLTLMTTDGGDEDLVELRASNSDWCVIAKPTIKLELD